MRCLLVVMLERRFVRIHLAIYKYANFEASATILFRILYLCISFTSINLGCCLFK